jgi:hypothetical protein
MCRFVENKHLIGSEKSIRPRKTLQRQSTLGKISVQDRYRIFVVLEFAGNLAQNQIIVR